MMDLYCLCNITKQGHHQQVLRELKWSEKEHLIVGLIIQIREIHPTMGLKTMYEFYKPEAVGRDAFISIGIYYGFRIKIIKNTTRTTFSSPFSRYKNLLVDKVLTDINQLWTSDITYFKVGEVFFYIVFIMDVYSRKIVGYSASDNMRAENNIEALKMAYKCRKMYKYKNLIHHSDRGGQYIDQEYVDLLTSAEIQISMCDNVLENAHIERVNGIIKNDYLKHRNITSLNELKDNLKRAVDTYNKERPHSSIGKIPPDSFEQEIKELEESKRLKLPIWTENVTRNINPNQCIIQF
jgi:putative transposase